MDYIRRNGSLSVVRQIEQGSALVSMVVNRSAGGKAELADFLPDRSAEVEDEDGEEGTVEDVMSLLTALATPRKAA
ncbi:hypothetical protein ACI2KS_23985 [Pseudomonas sp. NPDC087358]|uniref:hypothetical protein n=1 Tax=Pseudomonas sp. NPDC087358 TaxID=3364439 RepID=UPI00384A7F32